MSYFEDLTPYTYFPTQELPGTVNVGWLEPQHPFPFGETTPEFQAKLKELCLHRVNQTRGAYACRFCWKQRPNVVSLATSSAEIRVPGSGKTYAAPELIGHYVEVHHYKPPDEFIAAVLAWRGSSPTS